MTTNNAINTSLAGQTGTVNFVGSTSPTITTPNIVGVTNASSASAGSVGEVISSTATSSAVSLTSATPANATSISLTAGFWIVQGVVNFGAAGGASVTIYDGAINTTSATIPGSFGSPSISNSRTFLPFVSGSTANGTAALSPCLINVNTTTTVYLVGSSTYTGGTVTCGGVIWAIRFR